MSEARVIYWFRTDLRLHDSPALKAALDLKPAVLWPVFTWDPHYVYRATGGPNRWQLLLDCQNDLSRSITKLNPKSKLFVLREGPQTLFPKLFRAWKVTHLVYEKDTDAYARERDAAVAAAAKKAGVQVVVRYGRTLWDSDDIVAKHEGKPTMSITQLRAAGAKVGRIPRPLSAPDTLPDPGETPIDFERTEPETKPDKNAEWRTLTDKTYVGIAGPNGDFAPETLDELGFPEATTPHRGGETTALQKLDAVIADMRYTATFRKPRTSPAAFEPPSTTLLSPYLHFGALSVRLVYWRAQDTVDEYVRKGGKDASTPPESLTGQVLFRDMYFAAQAAIGAPFQQALHNAHCRFIPWHLPTRVDPTIGLSTGAYDVDSARAEAWFRRWAAGQTGFPWIDALMRQLRHEGWIHHLGRHSVACFLTRGGCWVSWERGAAVFEELLVDHEPAANAGNWQWLSCAAFFAQYHRVYSPVAFGRKWDPEGAFVRRWVPELRRLDARYIYEPWKAPIADQRRAGVRIQGDGGDVGGGSSEGEAESVYPKPMFDFAERRRVCLAAMKKAYDVGLHGNDPRVIDGSWKELFEDGGAGTETMDHLSSADDEEDDDDDGEHADDADVEPRRQTRRGAQHRKREATQGTLDGFVAKKKR